VQCGTHGENLPAYVCSHLLEGLHARDIRSIGFHEAEPDLDDPDSCGWCRACEEMRVAENGWNDRSEGFAGIRLICSRCFDAIRELANAPIS
jgi:hypothetical protein